MLCPFCGAELEKGSLVKIAGRSLFWLPEEKLPQGFMEFNSFVWNRSFSDTYAGSARFRRKYGGFLLRPDPEPDLYVDHYRLDICRSCGKGILNVVDASAQPPEQPAKDE